MRRLTGYLLILVIIGVSPVLTNPAMAARPDNIYCGKLSGGHFGPFDYVNRHSLQTELDVVENHHFTSDVENLIRGITGTIAGDLNYTLHAWPNHHRALVSLAKLSIRDKSTRFHGLKYPVECYFDRAMRMNATDTTVRSIYGGYLLQKERNKEAIEQLEIAVNLEPENATALYNLGLLHFKQKNYEKANDYAQKAYALDFPLPGLKNKLIAAGKWKILKNR